MTRQELELKIAGETFGSSCKEWLERWDNGGPVWAVSLAGKFGPGYEQCIQIMTAEMLRYLITKDVDVDRLLDDELAEFETQFEFWAEQTNFMKELKPSEIQYEYAKRSAFGLWGQGPVRVLSHFLVADRLIMVSKTFPSYSGKEEV